MDEQVQAVLDEYAARNEKEFAELKRLPSEEMGRRVDEFLIPVGPVVGTFLNELIKSSGAKTILELGMSYGYTSIYLAEAARATGGRVITTEIHPAKMHWVSAHRGKRIHKLLRPGAIRASSRSTLWCDRVPSVGALPWGGPHAADGPNRRVRDGRNVRKLHRGVSLRSFPTNSREAIFGTTAAF